MDTWYFRTLMSVTIEHMYFTFRLLSFNNNIHLNHPINLSFLEYKKDRKCMKQIYAFSKQKKKETYDCKKPQGNRIPNLTQKLFSRFLIFELLLMPFSNFPPTLQTSRSFQIQINDQLEYEKRQNVGKNCVAVKMIKH